jgi:deazaflavin-dependent oxidoreductase (nitroreductase family)
MNVKLWHVVASIAGCLVPSLIPVLMVLAPGCAQLLNLPIKLLFAIGVAPPGYALLETTGRKTGKPRRTPVGIGLLGRQFWIVAEHGQKAGYVRNIAVSPGVRLKLRDGLLARWYTGTAHLLSGDDPRERQRTAW